MSANCLNNRGYTLIEIIIVITVGGILSAIAAPTMKSMSENSRIKSMAREIYSTFQKAKTDAISKNLVSPLTPTLTFTTSAFNIAGKVGSYNYLGDPDPAVNMPGGVSLCFNNFAGNTATFNSRGLPTGSGRITLCNGSSRCYQLVLSVAGNISMTMGGGTDCGL